MKIDRLIGILSILLQQDKVTAPFLADKFEVSRRTINRDIEDLCKAGIPVVTTQGQNGGIAIMEGYRVDRALLTSSDMQAILAGLRGLDSVCGTTRYQQLMEKLSAGTSEEVPAGDYFRIDLASWYKASLSPKLEMIRGAIEQKELIRFQYYAPSGESERIVEPYLLVFQWAAWYVWGYCLNRKDYRLFKLNRMLDLTNTGENFIPREVPALDLSPERIFPEVLKGKLLFSPEAKWRLIEEYGRDSFTERSDGKLVFEFSFADKENLYGWLWSFGLQAELLEPEELRQEFGCMAEQLSRQYRSVSE